MQEPRLGQKTLWGVSGWLGFLGASEGKVKHRVTDISIVLLPNTAVCGTFQTDE
jgi:hypothetical protein